MGFLLIGVNVLLITFGSMYIGAFDVVKEPEDENGIKQFKMLYLCLTFTMLALSVTFPETIKIFRFLVIVVIFQPLLYFGVNRLVRSYYERIRKIETPVVEK